MGFLCILRSLHLTSVDLGAVILGGKVIWSSCNTAKIARSRGIEHSQFYVFFYLLYNILSVVLYRSLSSGA